MKRLFGLLLTVLGCAGPALAAEATVAVAANFLPTLRAVATDFEHATGHRVIMLAGSSGAFYGQIRNGAPFDVFFSADQERPRRLEEEGLAVKGSRFTYAVGRLVLWSPEPGVVIDDATLRGASFKHLAIANPRLAPYGVAAKQVMVSLGLWDRLQPRIVRGESLGQTMAFVASGNAELGFVALSQVLDPSVNRRGSRWEVPPELHDPLNQDVVLLRKGDTNRGAQALMEYVGGPAARRVIARFGYGVR